MAVFNNFRSCSKFSSKTARCILQSVRFRNVFTAPKECSWRPTVLHQPTVYVSACPHRHYRHNALSFRSYSEVLDSSNSSNQSKDALIDTKNDSKTKAPRSSEVFNVDVLVTLLKQENAVDICVIKVPEQIKYAEYFMVVSGLSARHLKAMALYAIKVYKYLKKDHDAHVKIEGKDAEDWMCIDFGHMVVHFMLPETREVYELEKLWTLRSYDEQLKNMPVETLPKDFIYDIEVNK